MAEGAANLLKRVPIFSDLDNKELERIAASMKQRTFNAGDTVTSEGQTGVGFFVIEDGEATVSVAGDARRRQGGKNEPALNRQQTSPAQGSIRGAQ